MYRREKGLIIFLSILVPIIIFLIIYYAKSELDQPGITRHVIIYGVFIIITCIAYVLMFIFIIIKLIRYIRNGHISDLEKSQMVMTMSLLISISIVMSIWPFSVYLYNHLTPLYIIVLVGLHGAMLFIGISMIFILVPYCFYGLCIGLDVSICQFVRMVYCRIPLHSQLEEEEAEELASIRINMSYYTLLQIKKIDNNNSCSICHEDFRDSDRVNILHCGHSYHINCIDKWREGHMTCPLCRDNIN